MSRKRIMPASSMFAAFNKANAPKPDVQGEAVVQAVDAFVRRKGWSHSKIAAVTGVEPARVTMFLNRNWPADWQDIATAFDRMLSDDADREHRESLMPVMTPVIRKSLGLANVLIEDGGIGLIQGDSGVGKTEATRAIALRYPKSITMLAATCRARPKPMLEDIGSRLHISLGGRYLEDVYSRVVEGMPYRCELLIVDEAHRYIGRPDCLHTLADLLKETAIPQLWTATGDLIRYLNRRVGQWSDPFAQIRSRITHTLDLNLVREAGGTLAGPDDVRELGRRKFELTLDPVSCRDLAKVAGEHDAGGLRVVESILKDVRRAAGEGMSIQDAVRRSIDRKAGGRLPSRRAATRIKPTPAIPPAQTTAMPSEPARTKVG